MYQPMEDTTYCLDGSTREISLWERVLGLVEQDLAGRRDEELFVDVRDGDGVVCRKEIGELSAAERGGLDPALKEGVAERLLDRHLAEQGRVDLVEKRRAYTKKVRDLTPDDLPALIEADRWRIEEERERAEFVRDTRADLEQIQVAEYRTGYLPLSGRAASLMASLKRGR